MPNNKTLLSVQDLSVSFSTPPDIVRAVRGVSFDIKRGESLGLIGESGSGKSVTGLTLIGLQGANSKVAGRVFFNGRDLSELMPNDIQNIRGREIGYVFQNPLSALNPVRKIGSQFLELLKELHSSNRKTVYADAKKRLAEVGIPDPDIILRSYPHELSGGLNQRVIIAMALAGDPKLLIADEPTTALDVITQAQIMQLLVRLRHQRQLSVLFISHDLTLISSFCERIAVIYAGRIVEVGQSNEIISSSAHPYTFGLLRAVPKLNPQNCTPLTPIPGEFFAPTEIDPHCSFQDRCFGRTDACLVRPKERKISGNHIVTCHNGVAGFSEVKLANTPLVTHTKNEEALAVRQISKVYQKSTLWPFNNGSVLNAVSDVSFNLKRGESLGIVGESGSGKSTLARMIVGQISQSSGSIEIGGELLRVKTLTQRRKLARKVQIVFQHPLQSLNPRMTILESVAEPLIFHGTSNADGREILARRSLEQVGLTGKIVDRKPTQLSGGQLQRVVLARALVLKPDLLVCDEPVSALDVSIQAQILSLLNRLCREQNLTLLFISHDLSVVANICENIAVMHQGRLIEIGQTREVLSNPQQPYTRQLIDAVPVFNTSLPQLSALQGLPIAEEHNLPSPFFNNDGDTSELSATQTPAIGNEKPVAAYLQTTNPQEGELC